MGYEMTDTSDRPNGDLPVGSTEAAPQDMLAASFPARGAVGDTNEVTISVRGVTERERMVQQLKTIADRLVLSLRNSGDPRVALQHETDLLRAVEAETATAKQEAETTSFYLGQVSHDIRSRMTSILGYADLLLDTSLTDEQSLKVRNLKEATLSLLLIINDLLDISALEAGQLQLVWGPVNLHALAENVRSTASRQAAAKGLYLRCEVSPDAPEWVSADATRLSQVLLNLVVDGLKSTIQGGVRISIAGGPVTAPDLVRFEVNDTGNGIPLDQQETLFRPFSRSGYSYDRPSDGTGLSLSISKRLVEAMGGTIGVERPADGGGVCWFEVPLVKVDAPAAASPVATVPSLGRKGHILVAEDLPMNQMVIREILEAAGHQVTIAEDGIAAINALHNDQFDLILMDVAMPTMGGLETAQALRGLDGARTIPIVALTAHTMPNQIAACRAAGMDDYLSKPIDRKVLLETVGWWLDRRATPPVRALHVLVADDILMNRDIAASFLRAAGHNVTCVEGGAQAIAAIAKTDFDVVLMDVRMPEMDGLEATRRIRALTGARGRVPIVALTAHAFAEQVGECYEAGMDDHVSKPFDQETLISTVLRAAGAGSAHRESPNLARTSTIVSASAAMFPADPELPIRDPIAFERTAVFLAPDTVEAYLQVISERGESLLRGLRGSSDVPAPLADDERAEMAHTLAGSAGMFGFLRLADLGRRFEWAVKCRSAETPALADRLRAAVEATLLAIRDDRQDWALEARRRGPLRHRADHTSADATPADSTHRKNLQAEMTQPS
jgi:CheY-like chemotaxis protein/HPt (histidine-containing phosphotransfer) domain-containing protein